MIVCWIRLAGRGIGRCSGTVTPVGGSGVSIHSRGSTRHLARSTSELAKMISDKTFDISTGEGEEEKEYRGKKKNIRAAGRLRSTETGWEGDFRANQIQWGSALCTGPAATNRHPAHGPGENSSTANQAALLIRNGRTIPRVKPLPYHTPPYNELDHLPIRTKLATREGPKGRNRIG
jgi:hypothetical protein